MTIKSRLILLAGILFIGSGNFATAQPLIDISIADLPGIEQHDPVRLFDGRTLEGWGKPDGSPRGNWSVDNGTIFRNAKGGDLYFYRPLHDFDLKFDFKISENGNSGLKYRVQKYGNSRLGLEYQIQDDKKHKPIHTTAAVYDLYRPKKSPGVKVGKWNNARIVVYRNRIEHWLNDVLVVEATVGSGSWFWNVRESKFAARTAFAQNRAGRIFLQDHGHPVWFRNMYIRPLSEESANLLKSGDGD